MVKNSAAAMAARASWRSRKRNPRMVKKMSNPIRSAPPRSPAWPPTHGRVPMAKFSDTSKFTGSTCGEKTTKSNLKMVYMPAPTAAPIRMSEATCGSRQDAIPGDDGVRPIRAHGRFDRQIDEEQNGRREQPISGGGQSVFQQCIARHGVNRAGPG